MKAATIIVRVPLGLRFVVFGSNAFLHFIPMPLKGSSQSLKGATKSKPIRLVDGDHEISCKIGGIAIGLKACFVKKA